MFMLEIKQNSLHDELKYYPLHTLAKWLSINVIYEDSISVNNVFVFSKLFVYCIYIPTLAVEQNIEIFVTFKAYVYVKLTYVSISFDKNHEKVKCGSIACNG